MVTWREALRWWREGEFAAQLPPETSTPQCLTFGQITIIIIAGSPFSSVRLEAHFRGPFCLCGGSTKRARLSPASIRKVTLWSLFSWGPLPDAVQRLNAVRFPDVDPKGGQV